jgi:UDP-arabinose 4-epimerase
LARAGHTLLTLDSLERGHNELVQFCPLAQGALEDKAWLHTQLTQFTPDVVVHLAGYVNVAESVKEPALYQQKNVDVTRGLLACMKEVGIRKFIYSSTGSVYASAAIPVAEDAPLAPQNPYAQSKLDAEAAIAASGVDAVIFRYFNAAGADAEGTIGEMHEPETHVIPLLIQNAGHFTINGNDYATADGTAVRDYIHVSDIASAHEKSLGFLGVNPGVHHFNLGTGVGTSVKALVEHYMHITNTTLDIRTAPRRVGDAEILVANAQRAERVLGWQATHSSMGNILRTALHWHQSRA